MEIIPTNSHGLDQGLRLALISPDTFLVVLRISVSYTYAVYLCVCVFTRCTCMNSEML